MASTFMDVASGAAILKTYYTNEQRLNWLIFKNFPALALVKKNQEMKGSIYPVPVLYATSQGASSSFANAQTNQTPAASVVYQMTRKSDYSLFSVTNEAYLASEGSAAAFVSLLTTAADGGLRTATMRLSSHMFRSGTGSIGQIATGGITAGVITLTNIADLNQFEVGQTLQANSTDGGATPRAALGFVIAVDRSPVGGTLTVSATAQGGAAGSPAGWAAADFLLVQGDNNACVSGMDAWFPTTAPGTSDSFYGVNRSTDSRLSGYRFNATSQSLEEGILEAAIRTGEQGAASSHCFMPFTSYAGLQKSLASRLFWEDITSEEDASIGFRAIVIQDPVGKIYVLADRYMQASRAFLLDLETCRMGSIGRAPRVLEYADGLSTLRINNADALEGRCGMYGNFYSTAPIFNASIQISQ